MGGTAAEADQTSPGSGSSDPPQHLTMAISNKQAEKVMQAAHAIEDLQSVLKATRAITSTLRLADLLATVVGLACEVAHTETASLLLRDPITDELYFDVALGDKGGALQQVRLKKGE